MTMNILVLLWLLVSLLLLVMAHAYCRKTRTPVPAGWALVPVCLVAGPPLCVLFLIKLLIDTLREAE